MNQTLHNRRILDRRLDEIMLDIEREEAEGGHPTAEGFVSMLIIAAVTVLLAWAALA
jgi:hypothetical protein